MRDDPDLNASIIRALRGKGYKATPQRIAVGQFTLRSKDHPTPQRIYDEVKKVYPTVSLATIYKSIRILKEVGMVQELSLPDDQTRLDSNTEPHINLVCLRCGSVHDSLDTGIKEMIYKISLAEQFAATGQRIDIYGICKSCNASEMPK